MAQNQHPEMISAEQLRQNAPTLKERYILFQMEGWILFSLKGGAMKHRYLDGLENKEYWGLRQWQSDYWTNGMVASARRALKSPSRVEIYVELVRVELEDAIKLGLEEDCLPER